MDRMKIEITKAHVLTGNGADKVMLFTELKDACYPYSGVLTLSFVAACGTGAHYCRENFNIDPEVTELNHA